MAGGLILLSAALAGAVGLASSRPAPGTVFKDGAPARVTGGFGEDTCFACHFDGVENAGEGAFTVSGFPERYSPGGVYPLALTLSRPGMAVAGFQLAVRYAENGAAAGALAIPPEEDGRVGLLTDRQIQFAYQLLGGMDLQAPETGRWSVLWTAPESGNRVLLHAAALAGDGDDSQLGDHVHTVELESRGR